MQVTTKSGFTCEVRPETLKDYRFLRHIREMKDTDPTQNIVGMVDMAEMILGVQGVERLLEHVQNENGDAPAEDVAREVGEIIQLTASRSVTVKNF